MMYCGTVPTVPYMPVKPVLARAYVPYQVHYKTYNLTEGLHKGTIFPELYSPYEGKWPKGGICSEK